MPRVETVTALSEPLAELPAELSKPPEPIRLLTVPANSIILDPDHALSRPGPLPPNEQKKIEALAQSLRAVGQIQPIRVSRGAGGYHLVAGGRRLAAAQSIRPDFPVDIIVDNGTVPGRQTAIHENIHRRNYTPMQFARLCRDLQQEHGWSGTTELSDYLGVSRAQITQHLKLLTKPEDMPVETYETLIARLNSGIIGADTAFFALTHVKEAQAPEVIERAQEIAKEQAVAPPKTKAKATAKATAKTAKVAKTTVKTTAKAVTANVPNVPEPEWMRKQREEARKRRLAAATSGTITVPQLKQAAKELNALKSTGDGAKTVGELQAFVSKSLAGPGYPDLMRNFITFLAVEWMRGGATDEEVMQRWRELAMAVESYHAHLTPPVHAHDGKPTRKKKQ